MEATIDIRTADGNVNILLDEVQVGKIRGALVDLCLSTMAVFAMLIDAAGRVVAVGGETKEYEVEALAALSAADLATSRQLAALLGEPEFSLLFQHEKQKNMFMTAIESDAILIVVFDVDTTFGTLRLRIRRSISQLQDILQQAKRSTVVALSETADITRSDVSAEMAEEELSAAALPAPADARASVTAPLAPQAVQAPADARASVTAPLAPQAVQAPADARASVPEPGATAAGETAAPVGGAVTEPPFAAPQPAPAVSVPAMAVPATAAPAAAGSALPPELAAEIRKALVWFANFKGWSLLFSDEVSYLKRAVERAKPDQVDTVRVVFLRTRARLTEQKRLLEARFRILQSVYQQFVAALQMVMQGAWKEEIVDRAMKAAFTAVGTENNLVGSGVAKKDGAWTMDFALIGKQLVNTCHQREWTYQMGMMEMVRQMNGGLTALSAFVVENPRFREDLTKNWARIYRHYSEGLKTMDLEPEVLDLFRPLVRSGQMPK
jgi:predicted regulator of Ras-like GTPase activity (Roadblock/LC7/MglB family)